MKRRSPRCPPSGIPVKDQDRTKALFDGLGLETRFDADLGGGFRWIELVPPGAETSIALVAKGEGLPTGVDTGIRLFTPDARAMRSGSVGSGSRSASCSTGTPRP